MPDETRTVGQIMADFYSGNPISDEDKDILRAKAAKRLDAWTYKEYDKVARARSRQPGILFKSGAASVLHPLQEANAVKLRDDGS